MSQYDHVTGAYSKKPLSQRWHRLGDAETLVQWDIYSAFLARNAEEGGHHPSRIKLDWAAQGPRCGVLGCARTNLQVARPGSFRPSPRQ